MEYLRGWRALRADPGWLGKVGVGTVLILSAAFIPIFGQVIFGGWLVLALRRAVQGSDSPLPDLRFDFDYMKDLAMLGWRPLVAQILYMLPLMAVGMLAGCLGGFMNVIIAQAGDSAGIIALVVLALIWLVYMIALVVLLPVMTAAMIRASLMEDFKAAIGFGEVRAMAKLIVKETLLGTLVLGFITMPMIVIGMFLCYVGAFPAAAITSILFTYLHAEMYKAYLAKGGVPLPIADAGPLGVSAAQVR